MMTAKQVHETLKTDKAYIESIKMWKSEDVHAAVMNMRMVLSAHGFKSTTEHAITMFHHAA